MGKSFKMSEKVFIYPSEFASWHFIPVTRKVGQGIKETYGKNARGFGSLPVTVKIGLSVWDTSIFPDKYSGSYILPLKASVRKKEDIEAGEVVTFEITLR
jgi:Domain of unknown function (DUF1905)